MRKILVILFTLLLSTTGFAQEISEKESFFPKYQGVVTMENKSKDVIFSSAKLWVAENFRSAQNVIQLDDAENGVLLIKANFVLYYSGFPIRNYFTLKVEAKDGRFRYTVDITDMIADAPGGKSQMEFFVKNLAKEKAKDVEYEKQMHAYCLAMAKGIASQTNAATNEEDW